MSAPMVGNIPVSRKTLKFHVLGNVSLISTILCLISIPFNTESSLDVVSNVLTSTKVYSFLMIIFHLTFHLILANVSGGETSLRINFKDGMRAVVMSISSVFLFHVVAVLFGASFFENTAETFHFALLLTCITVVPIFIYLGISSESWTKVFAFNSPDPGTESMVYASTIGSILGAWLGAFSIPLDWDRPWQVWPISCVVGTLFGHCFGLMINSIYICVHYYRTNKFKLG